MGASYYQFCPVAKAMELLDERWTLLIVRELCSGSERFNEVRRGVPRMSPTLLSKRLTHLTRAGIVERVVDGTDVRYVLTPAGRELRPVVEALSVWGVRWIGELGDADLDPKLLLWDMRRSVDGDAIPVGRRTVVRFRFPDVPARARDWWLVITAGDPGAAADADLCDADPGFEVDVTVTSRLRRLIEIWRGDLRWADALRAGDIDVHGPEDMRRGLPGWFTLPGFAAVPRPT
ncbi:helix-turn-helix transcriptional regulator [Streptomycetaceae bacterium NBC_01309]